MEVISGVVEKVSEMSNPAGSPKKWTKKSFNINGEWLGNFLTKENINEFNAISEGDAVKATFETKGNYKNLMKIEVIAKNEPENAKQEVQRPTSSLSTPYNVQDKDYRITYLASRRDAIDFVKTLVQLDLVGLGTKKSDKVDNFYAYVKEYASKFAEDAYVSREDNAIPVVEQTNNVIE
jgi:hypothetical protein